jgi:hypothetical protein
MIKKIFIEFVAGCIFSIPGAGCAGGIYLIFSKITGQVMCSQGALVMILSLGIPIGILVGISVADRWLSKHWKINIFGLVIGFILGLFGMVLEFFILDSIGNAGFFLMPVIPGLLSVTGYNVKILSKSRVQ